MSMTSKRPGFILVLTLMVTSLAVIVVSYLIYRTSVFVPIAKVMTDREKAQQLALGGVQLAISKIAYADVVEKAKKEEKPAEAQQKPGPQGQQAAKSKGEKEMLESLLPFLNRWHRYTFDRVKDGFEGSIEIYLACEEGKININEIFDFSKHTFVGKAVDIQNVLKAVFEDTARIVGGALSIESFEKFLKAKDFKLQDVTDLLLIKEFEPFKERLFNEPSYEGKDSSKKRQLYLTDIFTIWSQVPTVEPWMISESLGAVLGFKSIIPKSENAKGAEEKIKPLLKEFKPQYSWPADWDKSLSKFYGKEFKALPKGIQSLLGTTFEPHIFSVISYGTVGKISHRLFAILERDRAGDDLEQPANVSIKKLYWI